MRNYTYLLAVSNWSPLFLYIAITLHSKKAIVKVLTMKLLHKERWAHGSLYM